jgi:hypothetical protein
MRAGGFVEDPGFKPHAWAEARPPGIAGRHDPGRAGGNQEFWKMAEPSVPGAKTDASYASVLGTTFERAMIADRY